ncbi:MAG TPA: iron-containing redox enzyme family protein [Thermoanaerobaculia bacterium]|nr:iron-containing redox enzyme family protein [Thermoanaerobaculia bacterium]
MMEAAEFRKTMEKALHGRLGREHAIVAELEKPPGNLPLLRMFALQGYQLTKNFARYVGGLYHHCPIEKYRIRLAINLYEEETGKLSKSDNHLRLMQKFLRALGISEEQMETARAFPATQELIDWRWQLVNDRASFHRAAAAIAIASEGQNLEQKAGKATKDLLPGIYGLSAKDLQFFTVHATEDVYHVRDGLHIVAGVCDSQQMQDEALQAIHDTCDRFEWYFDGVLQIYQEGIAA